MRIGLFAATLLACLTPVAAPAATGLRLERVVIVIRHGVRPPTKAPPLPAGSAADPWPAWPVPPGHLTPHGADGLRRLAAWDRAAFAGARLIPPSGCPPQAAVRLASDSDQRTIATGDVYADALLPGCLVLNHHRDEGQLDPLFATAGEGADEFDTVRANRAATLALGSGGMAGREAALRPLLTRIDRILCGGATAACGIGGTPSALVPASPGKRPKLSGALERGSTAAQILLLEYADGKPMAEIGFGRASAADIAAVSALHAAEFAILVRPPYLSARNAAPIAHAIIRGLNEPMRRLTIIAGHDTNIAAVGGLLNLHWQVPGYAPDDPAPGGALIFEQLRGRAGRVYVRARYRAQTLEQLRRLTPLGMSEAKPYDKTLTIEGCKSLCPINAFAQLLRSALEPQKKIPS